jgi:hypothetical protein
MSNIPNLPEIGKIIREMQKSASDTRKANSIFSQQAEDIVKAGVNDKMRAKGWPVSEDSSKKTTL